MIECQTKEQEVKGLNPVTVHMVLQEDILNSSLNTGGAGLCPSEAMSQHAHGY